MARKAKGPWSDYVLRGLAKRRVEVPLRVTELTHAAVIRRFWRMLAGLMAGSFGALALLFAALGLLPGFIDRARYAAVESGVETTLLAVLFGTPLLIGILVFAVARPRVRPRPDEADHPWHFQATAEGLSVTSAGGRRWQGAWGDWRYAGYRYIQIKMNRVPVALAIARDGQEITVEFARFRRREALALAAAILRGLASAGQGDGPGGLAAG